MDILAISTQPKGRDPLGEVEIGCLKAHGHLTDCILRLLQNSDSSQDWYACQYSNDRPMSVFFPDGGEFDDLRIERRCAGYSCLLVGTKPCAIGDDPLRYALVLQPVTGKTSTFRRVGIMSLGYTKAHLPVKQESFAWLKAGQRRVVDIV
jgi:hypothetical protein